jgi:hypothetical protein
VLPEDRYIPVRVDDLAAAIAGDRDTFGDACEALAEVDDVLERVVCRESVCFSRVLERCYAPVNPDRDTIAFGEHEDELAQKRASLFAMLAYLFDKANYERLDESQLRAAIATASTHGMAIRVVPEKVESIAIYVRGRGVRPLKIRTFRRPWSGEVRQVDLYRRLAVVFRMRGSEHMSLKLFREIPVADVEALLPHAEVRMSTFDRIKIVGGGMGALGGVAWKTFTVLVKGAVFASQFLWAVIVAFLGLSVRSVFGYRRARYVRTAQMTHNLYYQNVANNGGVLDLLVTSTADEELKEVMLVYALLVADEGRRLRDPAALGAAAEAFLSAKFGAEVDFDVADALESLDRFQLWEDREAFRVLAPGPARAHLETVWRERLTEAYHAQMAEARRQREPRSSSERRR